MSPLSLPPSRESLRCPVCSTLGEPHASCLSERALDEAHGAFRRSPSAATCAPLLVAVAQVCGVAS